MALPGRGNRVKKSAAKKPAAKKPAAKKPAAKSASGGARRKKKTDVAFGGNGRQKKRG